MDREIWKNPESVKGLDEAQCPLWFWNDKLENEELVRQLRLMSEVGVKSCNPHARTNGGEGFIGGYLDDEWFDHIKTVVDYKKESGEPMWLYDEIDWPAGTCGRSLTRNEDFREHYLVFETHEIPAGSVFKAQRMFALALYIVDKESGDLIDLAPFEENYLFGPELCFKSDRDAVCYIVRVQIRSYDNGGDEEISYINKEATEAFLKSTYELYAERYGDCFGNTITTVFNDETRMSHAFVWDKRIPELFKETYGYDIMECLYLLPLEGERAGRLRIDYYNLIAEMYGMNYFEVIRKWCNEHKLKLFAHLLGEESIYGHARYSGDYLRQYRHMDVAGVDHLGKGIGSLNIKFASSAAHSYGKERTAVEVFAGCGWDMTYEEYIRMITWMFQMGMQTIINHGFFYSDRGERKNDWPPSQFFQWKGFDRMAEANRMTRRLHYALTDGYNDAHILVYHPLDSFLLDYQPDNLFTHAFISGPVLKSERARRIDQGEQLLMNTLLCENMDFEVLHRDACENFVAEKGAIENRLTGQRFIVLILPYCKVLPVSAARIVKDFAIGGGRIICVKEISEMGVCTAEDAEVQEIFDEIRDRCTVISGNEIRRIADIIGDAIVRDVEIISGTSRTINNHMSYGDYLIDPYVHTGEDISGVMFNTYVAGDERRTLFMNYGKELEEIRVRVRSLTKPVICDTLSGEVREVSDFTVDGDDWFFDLTLPNTHGIVVVAGM
ncbi:glycosyl hydrolase, partial [Butyrivibrio sp. VCB2001]|uniref:glycosyl hydrolase n=1 Tax=Butyrivibrio sp. VCB2001 TaxID=1280667 RepID=UPI00041E2B8C